MAFCVRASRVRRPAALRTKRAISTSARVRSPGSLRQPLPDVPNTTGTPSPLPVTVKSAKVNNGTTVITYESDSPVASFSLFIRAGSRFETAKNSGAAHFMARYAWKNSVKKYNLQLVRDLDVRGSTLETKHTRENIVATTVGIREGDFVDNLAETLGAIAQPLIEEYNVDRIRGHITEESTKAEQDGFTSLVEALHREAYRDQQLGNPLYTPLWQIDQITDDTLRRFTNTYYTRDRMTVVVSGVEEPVALELVEKHLTPFNLDAVAEAFAGPEYVDALLEAVRIKEPEVINPVPQNYIGGGEIRLPNAGTTKIAIGLPGVGYSSGVHALLVAQTLQYVLGGSEAGAYQFTPGQGRQSRLGANVVGKFDFVRRATAFNFSYSDAGLIGVFGEAQRGHARQLFDALYKELESAVSVTDAEVARAKSQVATQLISSVSSNRQALAEFFVAQAQGGSNQLLTPSQFIEQLSKVTTADVSNFAKKILASKPTIAASGDVAGIPKL